MDVSIYVALGTSRVLGLFNVHVQVVLLASKVDVLQSYLEGRYIFSNRSHICIAKVGYTLTTNTGSKLGGL